jgi:hypothetical protein
MKITNKLGLPTPFVDAVSSDYRYKDKQYSVTTLLKGVRESILTRRHHDELESDVADMIWLIFGSAVHKIAEQSVGDANDQKEQKLVIDMGDGYKLSGIFDLYNPDTQEVTDYKTASVWKGIYKDTDDWRKQLLIYAWMLNKLGKKCNKGKIVALYKDHKKNETNYGYPEHPVQVFEWQFTDQDFIDIEIWLNEKFAAIKVAETLRDDELPLCTDEERWYRGEKWAVMERGRKKATKLFESENEAIKWVKTNEIDISYQIVKRDGVNAKCLEYCAVRHICPFGRGLKDAKQTNESTSD